jgi:hypothetical protein
MGLISRVKNIMLDPDSEWPKIAAEGSGATSLFVGYVAILALIPAICTFVGDSIIGVSVSVGTFRVPLLVGLTGMVIGYIFEFVAVYAVALVINALAPGFRAQRNFPNALKLSVYSFTPAWLAGIFYLIPGLRFLTVLGLYGFYLLWTGMTPLMGTPRDKALFYAFSVLIAAIAITVALSIAQGAISAIPRPY